MHTPQAEPGKGAGTNMSTFRRDTDAVLQALPRWRCHVTHAMVLSTQFDRSIHTLLHSCQDTGALLACRSK